jgi:hypothetical protein
MGRLVPTGIAVQVERLIVVLVKWGVYWMGVLICRAISIIVEVVGGNVKG